MTISLQGRTGTASAPSDGQGNYRFPAVEPGTYSLRVAMPGFKPQRRDGIGIHVGTQLTILLFNVPLTREAESPQRARSSWGLAGRSSRTSWRCRA